MVDPIADMLTRIRNAANVQKPTAEFPFSKIKHEIAKIMEREGFISSVELKGRRARKDIVVAIKYEDKQSKIAGLRRVSKPGQRIYVMSSGLKKVKAGLGCAIVSTSKGLMTDKDARKQNIGGELLCEIW
ncbi:MAG: 30S ribosomal protein S8 [Candidatus Wildermuthbacteria bacterium]|nr:30S ribosomal protein S8 [Candidatus Wildermuthbacteria bacterium]